jgi:hypothetical protein
LYHSEGLICLFLFPLPTIFHRLPPYKKILCTPNIIFASASQRTWIHINASLSIITHSSAETKDTALKEVLSIFISIH